MSKTDFELIENLPFTTTKVIGARARIGLVVLSSDYTVEHEFRNIITMPGVDVYHARIRNSPAITPETLRAMEPLIAQTAELILPGDRLDVLAFGCTSASMVLGEALVDQRLREAKPMAKTTNPITAAFAAFKALGAKRIAVLTPYRADVNLIVRDYIENAGFTVPVFGSFNEELDPVVAAIDDDSLIAAINSIIKGRSVDAVFVSCTSVRMAANIKAIEAATGLPVTSSNHAMAWHCLRLAGVNESLPQHGSLYTKAMVD
ncbi:MAG: Asp/Glu racemase [Rhodobacterales bacterium]|jgi:maleate isomerase